MREERHLVLILTKVLDEVSRSRVALEALHHELLREAARSNLLGEQRVKDAQPIRLRLLLEKLTGLFDLLPNDLLYVHSGSLQDFAQPRILRVLTATWRE